LEGFDLELLLLFATSIFLRTRAGTQKDEGTDCSERVVFFYASRCLARKGGGNKIEIYLLYAAFFARWITRLTAGPNCAKGVRLGVLPLALLTVRLVFATKQVKDLH
jgi:hypothetical protein